MKITNMDIWASLSETGEYLSTQRHNLTAEEIVWALEWEDNLNLAYAKIFVELTQALEETEGMEEEYRIQWLKVRHKKIMPLVHIVLRGLNPHLIIWDMIKPRHLVTYEDVGDDG